MKKQNLSPLRYLAIPFIAISLIIPYVAHLCPLMSKSTPVIKISTGEIQGRVGYSLRRGKEFWQFLSIPYAEPPVGKLKFEPPIPLKISWEGVKQVAKYPPRCLQYEAVGHQSIQGLEDCLFLNVFVSSPSRKALTNPTRPVIVFIHGGGFLYMGSHAYHPDFFMDQDDIVLVTLNYRVGPYGFLNLAEPDNYNNSNLRLPRGNMGLKDQLLVLQWIQENISKFGGDPKKVTIFGEGSGAASVHYHIISPKSHGLFHKAISFSGTALNPWAFSHSPKEISEKYIIKTGCPHNDKEKLLECLHNMDADKLLKLQRTSYDRTVANDFLVPSIEVVKTADTFLEENPLQILKEGRIAKIPWIIGVTSGEGAIIASRFEILPNMNKKLEDTYMSYLAHSSTPELSSSLGDKVRCFYVGDKAPFPSTDKETLLRIVSKVSSDTLFYRGTHQAAKLHALQGVPTFLYYFNYSSVSSPSPLTYYHAVTPNDWLPARLKLIYEILTDVIKKSIFGPDNSGLRKLGIAHSEDTFLVWNMNGIYGYLTTGTEDEEISSSLVKTIVDFANSSQKAPPAFRGVQWPALPSNEKISNSSFKPFMTLLIDNSKTPKLIPEPYEDSLRFWNSVESEIS